MTRIALVEDDPEKLKATYAMLRSWPDADEIKVAKSLHTALRLVLTQDFDVVVLDMTMPNFDRTSLDDGGRLHAFAGREIIRRLKREGRMTPAIVVTSFDRFGEDEDHATLHELDLDLKRRFPAYLGTVQMRANADDWKVNLLAMLEKARGRS